MKTLKKTAPDTEQANNVDFISPSLQDLIKYEQRGKHLQAEAFYLTFKAIKKWLTQFTCHK